MKTNYLLHDLVYQRNRLDPNSSGWGSPNGFLEDLELIWHPLHQKEAFPQQGKLLDLGCGAGLLSIEFAKMGYQVTGIDIAPTAIEWAMENAAQANVSVQFIQGDILTLNNLVDQFFDIVVDGRCFHCIIGADRQQFLRSVHRILKVGGILTLCSMCNPLPNHSDYSENFDRSSCCLFYTDQETAIRYIGDSDEIIQEVMSAGFRILEVKLVAPTNPEDFTDLQLIAQKK
jgi:2-polyprenyl-3-methyl-5-hydroxy-6-metoxy-1,4-benzoquinol methylase